MSDDMNEPKKPTALVPYEDEVAAVANALIRAFSDPLPPNRCRTLALILVLGSAYGGGDALAGCLLDGASLDMIRRVATLLRVTPPTCGGMSGALMLLKRESENPRITALLGLLERASRGGTSLNLSELAEMTASWTTAAHG